MLIIALVLAVIGLAALVTAVVTSNELIAWVCIGASVLGVLLLIIDAIRERQGRAGRVDTDAGATAAAVGSGTAEDTYQTFDTDYPDDDHDGDEASVQTPPVEEPGESAAESDEPVEGAEVEGAESVGDSDEAATVGSAVDEGAPEAHQMNSDESDTATEVHDVDEVDAHSEVVDESDGTSDESDEGDGVEKEH